MADTTTDLVPYHAPHPVVAPPDGLVENRRERQRRRRRPDWPERWVGTTDDELVATWLHGRPANTVRTYGQAVRRLQAWLGRRPLVVATLRDLQGFADAIEAEGLKAGTRRLMLVAIRSFYTFAHQFCGLRGNPAFALRLPAVKDTLAERILSEDEVLRIIEVARDLACPLPAGPKTFTDLELAEWFGWSRQRVQLVGTRWSWAKLPVTAADRRGGVRHRYHRDDVGRRIRLKHVRNYAAILFLYATGARVSELLSLRGRDVVPQTDGGALVTLFGKRAKTRRVALPAAVWTILAQLPRGPDAPVFRNVGATTGRRADPAPLSRNKLANEIRAIARLAGIDRPVAPHWLRHSHASHALDNGAPLHVIQATLGHRSVTTTERYLHPKADDCSAAYLGVIGGGATVRPADDLPRRGSRASRTRTGQ